MMTIAHIVQPVPVDRSSDLFVAQPITFATMIAAREFAKTAVDVKLFAIQDHEDERMALPEEFIRLPDLTRSILDYKTFKKERKLPLIQDILASLFAASDALFFVYSNVDIALMPFFYQTVAMHLAQGYDALVINRRTITNKYAAIQDIPLMCAETGAPHKGYDCFIFKRALYPRFQLGKIHIGSAGIGRALLANMAAVADKFRELRNEHLTFHIGDSCSWRKEEYADYFSENWQEYLAIYQRLEAEVGGFDPQVRSYLLDTGERRIVPDFNECFLQKGRKVRMPTMESLP